MAPRGLGGCAAPWFRRKDFFLNQNPEEDMNVRIDRDQWIFFLPLALVFLLPSCGGGGGSVGDTDSSGSPPIVTTLAATSITPTSAILNGTAIPNGLPTQSWFEYGEDSALNVYEFVQDG
jgi:hypothetical protein